MERPGHITAAYGGVSLSPLQESHAETLLSITEPDDFNFFTYCPVPFTLDEWRKVIRNRNSENSFGHVIRVGDEIAGMSTIFDVDVSNRKLEIGSTLIAKPWRGTAVNPISKYLFMTKCFEEWNLTRVQLKGDATNARSMRAMEKLGFVREGTLRSYQILRGDYRRDVTFFSVMPEEWPLVREKLLSAIGAKGLTKQAVN